MNHDHHLSLDEFYHYYYSTLCFKFPILRSGVNPGVCVCVCKVARSLTPQASPRTCLHSGSLPTITQNQAIADSIRVIRSVPTTFRSRSELLAGE